MTTLIRHTKPILICKSENGLNKYRYNLIGIVKATCTTFRRTLREAKEKAKQDIKSYLSRLELSSQLNVRDADTKGYGKKESGWKGINYNYTSGTWNVQSRKDGKNYYVGHYESLLSAIVAKKKSNLNLGFGEYHGKREK